ncbi:transposase [Myxococcus fulvus]|uniref:Transposase n=1 Tax=Myxococcus fulvus TaxID=33 RepID=A0A511TBD9_MYXFU|nr:transposase [Myxococcus fulvus]SEU13567.1 transposase [Myxococcus fulvus]
MSATDEKPKKPRRPRREFTAEFKAGAVKLVQEGKSIPHVAKDLDLTESALRLWVEQVKTDRGEGKPGALTTDEREELSRLRKENRELRLEREILKNAAAFFAKEMK